ERRGSKVPVNRPTKPVQEPMEWLLGPQRRQSGTASLVVPRLVNGGGSMKPRRVAVPVMLVCLSFLPVAAWAQTAASGAIAGAVRDTSGAVMPGVTVEASSAALIEKVRTVVTDAQGLYRIVDLRPGTYKVTFTL